MKEIWEYSLFSIGGQIIDVGQVTISLLLMGLIFIVYNQTIKRFFPKLSEFSANEDVNKKSIIKILRVLAILFLILSIVLSLNLDYQLYAFERFNLTILLIIKALIFIQVVRIVDWFVSNVIIHSYFNRRDDKKHKKLYSQDGEKSGKKTAGYIFYLIVALYAIRNFGVDFTFFEHTIDGQIYQFNLSNIVIAILVIFLAKLIIWVVTQLLLYNLYKNKKIEVGSQFAINQLVAYVIYIFAFVIALDALGINMSILLGGAAALLVGVGLGLQQTFNDIVSGIVLLFERSVSVGDVLEFDDTIGTVKSIGLRSSIVETRSNVSMIVPNHLLVNESVVNWTHYNDKVRFTIEINVAYGSDTDVVKKILLDAVNANPYILEFPLPSIRFESFGASSLDFKIYFFSRNFMVIEDIKSDIRLEIDKQFRAKNISIPFPQREITIKTE